MPKKPNAAFALSLSGAILMLISGWATFRWVREGMVPGWGGPWGSMMGGFLIGAVLGIIGGALAISWQPQVTP